MKGMNMTFKRAFLPYPEQQPLCKGWGTGTTKSNEKQHYILLNVHDIWFNFDCMRVFFGVDNDRAAAPHWGWLSFFPLFTYIWIMNRMQILHFSLIDKVKWLYGQYNTLNSITLQAKKTTLNHYFFIYFLTEINMKF
jgi:hypothetical protein